MYHLFCLVVIVILILYATSIILVNVQGDVRCLPFNYELYASVVQEKNCHRRISVAVPLYVTCCGRSKMCDIDYCTVQGKCIYVLILFRLCRKSTSQHWEVISVTLIHIKMSTFCEAMWYANKHVILWHTGILFLQFLTSHNCRCCKVHSSIFL